MSGIPTIPQPQRSIIPSSVKADSADPLGEYVPPSGGSMETLHWVAPFGVEDGRTLIVSSSAHTFDTPEKLTHMGFGQGWLYNQPDDAPFIDHTVETITGTEVWVAGASPLESRTVKTVDGRKYLYTDFQTTANPDRVGAGMLNWDTGSAMVPGDRPFMYRVSQMLVGSGATTFQWKAERIGPELNLGEGAATYPSAYLKHFAGGPTVNAKFTLTDGDGEFYYADGLNKSGDPVMSGWQWKQNTPDAADGGMVVISAELSDGNSFERQTPVQGGSNYPDDIITSEAVNVPRYLKVQDYIGNLSGQSDIELWTTDYFWQLNGSIFVLANNSDLNAATIWTPVVPVDIRSSSSWELKLWRGLMSDYSSAHLFLLDADLNVVAGVAL